MENPTNIVARVPGALLQELKRIAEQETKKTGFRVDVSSIVRRALTQDIEARKKAEQQEAGE